MKIKKIHIAILVSSGLLGGNQVFAAGFQVTNHSATGLGRANAGEAAIADNASVLSRNPAAMMMFDTTAISGGLNVIAPSTDVTGVTFTNAFGTTTLEDGSDITNTSTVPNFYAIHPINEEFAIGLSAYTDFGTNVTFSDEFNDQGNLVIPGPALLSGAAGFFGGTTKVTTFNFAASLAYRVNNSLSLGASVKALKGEGEFDRQGPLIGADTYAGIDFKGDGWAYGWDIGALYEVNENHRFGLSYKSAIDFEADSSKDSSYNTLAGLDEITSIELALPAITEFSGYHGLNDQWAVHYSAMYIGWSSFEKIRFNLEGTDPYDKMYGWEDSWRLALGTTYQLNEEIALRTGVALDKSPIPKDKRVISIPDSDRMWYSAGGTYAFANSLSVDLGVTYVDGKKTAIEEDQAALGLTMAGDTKTTAWIYGLQVNYEF